MNTPELPFTLSNRAITRERLVTALIFALLAHGVILLGVGFVALVPKPSHNPMVDVTLVRTTHVVPPRRIDYLAQADQRGPGNRHRLDAPIPALGSGDPFPQPGVKLNSAFRSSLSLQTTPSSPPDDTGPHEAHTPPGVVESTTGRTLIAGQHAAPSERPPLITRLVPPGEAASHPDHAPIVTLPEIKGHDPQRNATATNARASVYAPYLTAWRARVETVGNKHYATLVPARIQHGRVTLTITLDADGSIHSIQIVHRSRYPVLDAAALKMIRMAAPFPPFPEDIRKRSARLSFTYQWNFIRGARNGGSVGVGSQP